MRMNLLLVQMTSVLPLKVIFTASVKSLVGSSACSGTTAVIIVDTLAQEVAQATSFPGTEIW